MVEDLWIGEGAVTEAPGVGRDTANRRKSDLYHNGDNTHDDGDRLEHRADGQPAVDLPNPHGEGDEAYHSAPKRRHQERGLWDDDHDHDHGDGKDEHRAPQGPLEPAMLR